MKTSFLKAAVVHIMLVLGFLPVWASEPLQFELTSEKLQDAWFYEAGDGYYVVNVKLREPYREYFSGLTRDNIGKKLAITFLGEVLISPIIKGEIDSGVIQVGTRDSEEEARRFVERLLSKPGCQTPGRR